MLYQCMNLLPLLLLLPSLLLPLLLILLPLLPPLSAVSWPRDVVLLWVWPRQPQADCQAAPQGLSCVATVWPPWPVTGKTAQPSG